jgi:hypothetical protein
MHFPLLALVRFEGEETDGYITDHNRQATQGSREDIKRSERMANGTMREKFIATKRKYSFSFNTVPSKGAYTVDGYWSGEEIIAFYNENRSFTLKLYYNGDATNIVDPEEVITVMWEAPPEQTISKRGANFDFWDLSFTLVEV